VVAQPRPGAGNGTPTAGAAGRYRLHLSESARDPGWDGFLRSTTGGHHLQSSYWGAVKAILGWRAVRVVAIDPAGEIRGGAQVLLRDLPLVGSVGYVPLGPVLGHDDPGLRRLLLHGIQSVARTHHVQFLVVQPPAGQEAVVTGLLAHGFRRALDLVRPHPKATLLVDLSPDEDALLAAMRSRTRYNIRLAQRRGVRVRCGGEEHLDSFYRLLTLTGERQRFPVPSERYFRDLLRIMAPPGHAQIFVAEHDGGPLSAALVIAFGGLVSYKRGGWSGEHGHLHPNELMHWAAMRWAKREGYRCYDFEGIEWRAGDGQLSSVSAFKAGFGGEVVLLPSAYEQIHNPVLRRAYTWLAPRLSGSSRARWLINTIRTR
jgi:lipid II:glycine glycyltransferase (peptidoglycan interpeptide bridge formation enzyme)